MAKAIMVQGTSSGAGKSLLAAGLCRIFTSGGYRTAPFKSQNMALNSYVTINGKEMARAQVTQALACGIEPDVRFNPILLKPSSDRICQVIVNGQVQQNMNIFQYNHYKTELRSLIKSVYAEIDRMYDVIVIEGAGSPAEINLKNDDIVNMYVAGFTGAPVILVGDIDRGGVFASFVGTMELLDSAEQERVAGFIINKFRGEAALLDSGIRYLEQRTGKQVFGTVPMIPDLRLPDEDSVAYKSQMGHSPSKSKPINIGLIDLPHIANVTDYDALTAEPDVHLFSIIDKEQVADADILILPGSKNVIHDTQFLQTKGFFPEIRHSTRQNKMVIGICGGFQMLGEKILDPHGIESSEKEMKGLALLNITTELAPEKHLSLTNARCAANDQKITGYEIHHGRTTGIETPFILHADTHEMLGCRKKNVWGTYLHGIFDNHDFRRTILNEVRLSKGLSPISEPVRYTLETEFSKLETVLRTSLDIPAIYRLLELKEK